MSEELLGYIVPKMAIEPSSGSGAAFTATEVDARGYDRVCFLFLSGTMGTGSGISLAVQETTKAGGTYSGRTTTAALTDFGTLGAGKLFGIDVSVDGSKPFLKLAGTAGTATCYFGAVALLYRGGKMTPPTSSVLGEYVRKL